MTLNPNQTRSLAGALVLLALLSIGVSATCANDLVPDEKTAVWPQWRGPSRDGFVASDDPSWPNSLDEKTLSQTWRVELGPSYSGPIVAADRVFVTETEKTKNEVVRALDRATGKELWQARWEGAMSVPFFAWSNGSWIRATPASDGDTLYVAGMRDVLVALNAGTGEQRWRVDFVADYEKPLPAFGFVSSPLVTDQHIYVQAGAAVRKLEKQTGKPVWASMDDDGGMYGSAFSSPKIATLAGKEQLLVQTREKLAGLDLDTGAVLWSQKIEAFRGMNILTPTIRDDTVFTSSYGGRAWAFRVGRNGDAFTLDEVWNENTQAYMSTPVVIDGHAYLHLKNQRFTCIDLSTGERKWTTEPFGKYWSLVANGDRILALDERGELLLVRANPDEFDLLDRRKVSDDSTWAHLAVCGQEMFVRELNAVAAYRWGQEE